MTQEVRVIAVGPPKRKILTWKLLFWTNIGSVIVGVLLGYVAVHA